MKKSLLKTTLLLCALVVGSGSVWATDLTTADLIWPTPQLSENFNGVSTTSATATINGSTSAYGIFNKMYNNKTSNTYAIASNATFGSNALSLTMGSSSPLIASVTNKTFASQGAYSFKVLKTCKCYFGLYAQDNNNAFANADASVYFRIGSSAGKIELGNGSSMVEVGTYSTDIIEVCVVYNNLTTDATYGDGISLPAKRAHVFVNGTCVMNGSSPKAFTIPGKALTAFRVAPQTTSGNTAIVDDIKIYNTLPATSVPATISAVGWNTFSSPFALDFTSYTDANAYMVTNASGTTLTLAQVTGTVPANTGLLLSGTASDDVDIPTAASSTTDVTANKLKPGTGTAVNAADKYVLVARDSKAVFAHTGDHAATVAVGKAYLDLNGASPAHSFVLDDSETTGINNVNYETISNNRFFDMQGREVVKPTKGLYIVNGKKVIIK